MINLGFVFWCYYGEIRCFGWFGNDIKWIIMIIQWGRKSGHELFRLMAKAKGERGEAVVVFWGGFGGGWPRSKTRHSDIYLLFGEENKENNEYFDLKMLFGIFINHLTMDIHIIYIIIWSY